MEGERREREEHNTGRCVGECDPMNDTEVLEIPKMDCAQGEAMVLSESNMMVLSLGSNSLADLYDPRAERTFS
jgi:hypothetical protein